ncbi:MAG: DUF6493 family protein [Pseudomonadota bacterium]
MSVDLTEKRYQKLVRTRTPSDCLKFFVGMDNKERRRFAAVAQTTYRLVDAEWRNDRGQKTPLLGKPFHEQVNNARVGLVATATLGELKKLRWHQVPTDGFVVDIVRELRPPWVNAWVQHLSETEPFAYNDIRQLIDAGLCQKPSGDAYIIGMIEGLPGWRGRASPWDRDIPLAERIRAMPDIATEDVWRLFDIEGTRDASLSSYDKYIGGKIGHWSGALLELSNDGTLSRDRLLTASLDALARDFAQYRSGWFSRFHEALQPTLEERAARADQYRHLLGSTIPPTVAFALQALTKLEKAAMFVTDDSPQSLAPALQARAKSTVVAALSLLNKTAKRRPAQAAAIKQLSVAALIHERADVQAKALDLIDTLGGVDNDELAASVNAYANGIAPSLHERFNAMIGAEASFAAVPDQSASSAVPVVKAIEPITAFDDMHREFREVLEEPNEPLRVERLLDGLARCGADRPSDFTKTMGPLRKRAHAIVKRQAGDSLQLQLARLALAFASDARSITDSSHDTIDTWLAQTTVDQHNGQYSFAVCFARRSEQLLRRVRLGNRVGMLSAPTDSRGYVDAAVLLSRYTDYVDNGLAVCPIDMTLALLRLAPENRSAMASHDPSNDEFVQAIAFACGRDLPIGQTGWLWVAASCARTPYAPIPAVAAAFGMGLPDAGEHAAYDVRCARAKYMSWHWLTVTPTISHNVPSNYVATLFHLSNASKHNSALMCGFGINMVRWCGTIWPLQLDAFFSHGVCHSSPTERVANSAIIGFLEPLLEAHVPVGAMGCTLIILNLASIDPAEKSVALEALIAAVDDERLDMRSLQRALITLFEHEHIPLGRWTKALTDLSRLSTKHAEAARELIEGCLDHDPAASPRGIGGLLELLYELSIATDTPPSKPSALAYLAAVTGGGKLKKFSAKLLALSTASNDGP